MAGRISIGEVLLKVKEIVGQVDDAVDLLKLFNLVEVNLATEVLKLTDTVTIKINDYDEILVSQFPQKILSIIDVYYDNEKIGWGYHLEGDGDSILVPGYGGKEVTIEYHYVPPIKEEGQESDFPQELFDILVYGVISEYFIVMEDFEKSFWYNKKYEKLLHGREGKKIIKKWRNLING